MWWCVRVQVVTGDLHLGPGLACLDYFYTPGTNSNRTSRIVWHTTCTNIDSYCKYEFRLEAGRPAYLTPADTMVRYHTIRSIHAW